MAYLYFLLCTLLIFQSLYNDYKLLLYLEKKIDIILTWKSLLNTKILLDDRGEIPKCTERAENKQEICSKLQTIPAK